MSTVAIQGERGAFSHAAALRVAHSEPEILPCRTFEDLFGAVASGSADLGMVPVENTLAGSVQRNLDLLVQHALHAVAETRVRIGLCLVVPPDREIGDVRSAASHPVALQQCHRFFRERPEIRPVVAYDTAGSVRDLLGGDVDYDAAIGSALAAELYGGRVLLDGIEDDPRNYTRFLAVAAEPAAPSQTGAKTSIAFTVRHRPGSLFCALGCFARRGRGPDAPGVPSDPGHAVGIPLLRRPAGSHVVRAVGVRGGAPRIRVGGPCARQLRRRSGVRRTLPSPTPGSPSAPRAWPEASPGSESPVPRR